MIIIKKQDDQIVLEIKSFLGDGKISFASAGIGRKLYIVDENGDRLGDVFLTAPPPPQPHTLRKIEPRKPCNCRKNK